MVTLLISILLKEPIVRNVIESIYQYAALNKFFYNIYLNKINWITLILQYIIYFLGCLVFEVVVPLAFTCFALAGLSMFPLALERLCLSVWKGKYNYLLQVLNNV